MLGWQSAPPRKKKYVLLCISFGQNVYIVRAVGLRKSSRSSSHSERRSTGVVAGTLSNLFSLSPSKRGAIQKDEIKCSGREG